MAAPSEGNGLASSLTDLMTSLAVIFILLLVASHNNEQQALEVQQEDLASQQQTLAHTQADLDEARRELDKAKEKTGTTRYQILLALQNALKRFPAEGVRAETDPRDPLGLLVIVPEHLLKFALDDEKMPPGGIGFLHANSLPSWLALFVLTNLKKRSVPLLLKDIRTRQGLMLTIYHSARDVP